MQRFHFFLLLSYFFSCSQPSTDNISGNTHTVACNAAHVRTEPNREAPSKRLLKSGEKVLYIRETFYTEKIKIQHRERAEKWLFVSFVNSENNLSDTGWVYGGCLKALPGRRWEQSIDERLFLSGRNVMLGDCEYNTTECSMLCECDCCFSDLYFMTDHYVYEVFDCCCDNPVEFRIGRYAVSGKTLICTFAKQMVEDPSGYMDEELNSAPPKYKNEDTYPLELVIKTCSDGTLMMKHEKSGETAVFDKAGSCSEFLRNLRQSPVYDMLERLKAGIR